LKSPHLFFNAIFSTLLTTAFMFVTFDTVNTLELNQLLWERASAEWHRRCSIHYPTAY
jgi:hypothetical protein